MMGFHLFRVVLPVKDIEEALRFYTKIFGFEPKRVSPGRGYFNLGGVILACYDSMADGDGHTVPPNPEHIYIATSQLEQVFELVKEAKPLAISPAIQKMPWGERSFYFIDPFGNKLCFVQEGTEFKGN